MCYCSHFNIIINYIFSGLNYNTCVQWVASFIHFHSQHQLFTLLTACMSNLYGFINMSLTSLVVYVTGSIYISQELSYLSLIWKNSDLSQLWCHCCIIAFRQQTKACLFVHNYLTQVSQFSYLYQLCSTCWLSCVAPNLWFRSGSVLNQVCSSLHESACWQVWFRLQFLAM